MKLDKAEKKNRFEFKGMEKPRMIIKYTNLSTRDAYPDDGFFLQNSYIKYINEPPSLQTLLKLIKPYHYTVV